jgi:hypothetical protein
LHRNQALLSVFATAVLLLAACSSTTINGVWKDPEYRAGKLERVLVVSVARKDLMRRMYEDNFVRELQARGVDAAPGYKVLPAVLNLEAPPPKNLLSRTGYHFLLISRLADRKTIEILHPGTTRIEHFPDRHSYYGRYPYYRHWEDYYSSSFSVIETTPTHTSLNELVILETNVYNAADDIIFSVQTETLVDYGAEETIRDIVAAVLQAMSVHDLI